MPDERNLDRRSFLALLGTGLLSGCAIDPSSGSWGWFAWAEGVSRRLLSGGPFAHAMAKEYPLSAITKEFPLRNLNLEPDYADRLDAWKLKVEGLVEHPQSYTLAELKKAFPLTWHITRHDCVEGWSAIAEFGGVMLSDLIAAVKPKPEAQWVVMHAADKDEGGTPFYGSLRIDQAMHPQTILAYMMNGKDLTIDHGAPLRLRVPTQLGYKSTKYIHRIEFLADVSHLGEGKGGYWEDLGYEHYAGI
jgi:DMSO/TMAO reductase YedYZ molybdopterin-dependent catalytic subunit